MLGLMQCGNKIGLEIKGYESSIEALENKTPAIFVLFLKKNYNTILFVLVMIIKRRFILVTIKFKR